MKISTIAKSTLIAGSLLLSSMTFAVDIDHNADKNDIAISGYDTVAYFTQGRAVEGSHKYTSTYKNAIYQFSSKKNRDSFRETPEKYAPQFGGFCSMGVALDKKLDVDPKAFKIVDKKLYLNLNKSVQKSWLENIPKNIDTAESKWDSVKTKTAEELNKS